MQIKPFIFPMECPPPNNLPDTNSNRVITKTIRIRVINIFVQLTF